MIRELRNVDIEKIRKIHSEFYQNEFEFPDFFNNFLCAFVVMDDTSNIITVGGVRPIAEAVIMTDKSFSVRDRRTALYQMLDASEYVARHSNFRELHAFIQDEKWYKHLVKNGFLPTKGKPLVLEL